jgi:dienelactone hydrolase
MTFRTGKNPSAWLRAPVIGVLAVSAALAAGAGHAVAGAPSTAAPLTLPGPTGTSPVGTSSVRLVDTSRVDGFAPTPRARELVARFWYPAAGGGTVRTPYYAPPVAALYANLLKLPATTLTSVSTPARSDARAQGGRHPVVLFSAGWGVESMYYTELLTDLASHGYVVVAVDHTYEVSVQFPGGRFVPARDIPEFDGSSDRTRVADIRFVLGQLKWIDREGPLAGRLDLSHIAMVGHSAGGATVASVMQVDRRVIAGVDIDGTLRGGVEKVGLDRPFMFLRAHRGKVDDVFMNAVQFRTKQTGPLVTATFKHVQHLGFSDFMVLVPQLEKQLPGLRQLIPIGTADPARTVAAQRVYVRAFLDTYLRDRPSSLLSGGKSPFAGVDVDVQEAR